MIYLLFWFKLINLFEIEDIQFILSHFLFYLIIKYVQKYPFKILLEFENILQRGTSNTIPNYGRSRYTVDHGYGLILQLC